MGWVVRAAELPITRDGESVILKRGDPVPEAEFWEARDKLERTKHIYKVPDPPAEAPEKKQTPKGEVPKRKRGRPRKVVVSINQDTPEEEKSEE